MSLVDWIYPKICVSCKQEGAYICPACRCTIARVGDGLRYTGVVRKMIKEIKYRGTYDMVQELVDIWNPRFDDAYSHCVVTAIPMWESKKKERGFNQADLIARELARRWRLHYQSLLLRTRATQPMYGLTKVDRARNVRGAFDLATHAILPQRVILIDDVWTTGATLRECTSVLKRGGVEAIFPLTLAR